jgi:copper(I)-binding protein
VNAKPRTARRIGVGLVATAAALLMSACAAGRQAQTAEEKPTLDGSNATVGDIGLRSIAIAPPKSGTYEPGSDVVLIGAIVNEGSTADQLTAVTTSVATGWGAFASADDAKAVIAAQAAGTASTGSTTTLPIGGKSISVPPGQRAAFGLPASTGAVLLTDLKTRLYPAQVVKITFRFKHAGSVTMSVPVQITGKNNSVPIPELSSTSTEQ